MSDPDERGNWYCTGCGSVPTKDMKSCPYCGWNEPEHQRGVRGRQPTDRATTHAGPPKEEG